MSTLPVNPETHSNWSGIFILWAHKTGTEREKADRDVHVSANVNVFFYRNYCMTTTPDESKAHDLSMMNDKGVFGSNWCWNKRFCQQIFGWILDTFRQKTENLYSVWPVSLLQLRSHNFCNSWRATVWVSRGGWIVFSCPTFPVSLSKSTYSLVGTCLWSPCRLAGKNWRERLVPVATKACRKKERKTSQMWV